MPADDGRTAESAPRSGDEPAQRTYTKPGMVSAPRSGDEPGPALISMLAKRSAPRSGDEPHPGELSAGRRLVRPAQRG